jgi:hypothetical protein
MMILPESVSNSVVENNSQYLCITEQMHTLMDGTVFKTTIL